MADDDRLLLDISDAAVDMSQLIKALKPLVASKGATIDLPKLKKAAMAARKAIARSGGLATLDQGKLSARTSARGDWAAEAMEDLVALDEAIASAQRLLKLDPVRQAPRLIKAAKAVNAAAGRPSWAVARVRDLEKELPAADAGRIAAGKLFCGIDSRHVQAFPLVVVLHHLWKFLKSSLMRLPNL